MIKCKEFYLIITIYINIIIYSNILIYILNGNKF